MDIRQAVQMGHQRVVVLHHLQLPINVNNLIIPGRHNLAGFLLLHIPSRGDVVVRPFKNRQRLNLGRKVPPLRIRPGTWHFNRPNSEPSFSRTMGICEANRPDAVIVIREANGLDSRNSWSTGTRSSSYIFGIYMDFFRPLRHLSVLCV